VVKLDLAAVVVPVVKMDLLVVVEHLA
jgi:hypothetical protein